MRRAARWVFLAPLLPWLVACSTSRPVSGGQLEDFGSANTHARSFAASDARTCEAARRALLSQGYVIGTATTDAVQGKKSYQPETEVHVEVDLRVVCAREGATGRSTLAFVSALQDRYSLRKSNSSASLGVGAIGSVSLPFSGSNDSLVKVASETITSQRFYDRFFALLERYLAGQPVSPEDAASAAAPRVPVALAPAARPATTPPVPVPATTAVAAPVPTAVFVPPVLIAPSSPAAASAPDLPSSTPAAAAPAASAASGS